MILQSIRFNPLLIVAGLILASMQLRASEEPVELASSTAENHADLLSSGAEGNAGNQKDQLDHQVHIIAGTKTAPQFLQTLAQGITDLNSNLQVRYSTPICTDIGTLYANLKGCIENPQLSKKQQLFQERSFLTYFLIHNMDKFSIDSYKTTKLTPKAEQQILSVLDKIPQRLAAIQVELLSNDVSREKSSTESVPTKIYCYICRKNKNANEFVALSSCHHEYCKECLLGMLNMSFYKKTPLKCPDQSCNVPFTDADWYAISGGDQTILAALENRKTEDWIRQHSKSCPTPGCSFSFVPDEERGQIRCPQCHARYCSNCLINHHNDVSCDEAIARHQLPEAPDQVPQQQPPEHPHHHHHQPQQLETIELENHDPAPENAQPQQHNRHCQCVIL